MTCSSAEGEPHALARRNIGQPDQGARMIAIQLLVSKNTHHLAPRRPGDGNVLPLRLRIVGQYHQRGKGVRLNEEGDAFYLVMLGVGHLDRFGDYILGGNVQHRQGLNKPFRATRDL